jgi:cytochrome P450
MHVLLMRAFPGWYSFNSVYAMYPFSLPEKSRQVLTKLGTVSTYSFDLPKKPAFSISDMSTMTFITDYHAIIRVLKDQEAFKEAWGPSIKDLTGTMYMLGEDTKEAADQHVRLHNEIHGIQGSSKAMFDFFEKLTVDLIKQKSFPLGGCFEVDAVRE